MKKKDRELSLDEELKKKFGFLYKTKSGKQKDIMQHDEIKCKPCGSNSPYYQYLEVTGSFNQDGEIKEPPEGNPDVLDSVKGQTWPESGYRFFTDEPDIVQESYTDSEKAARERKQRKTQEANRNSYLKRMYGMTLKDYEALLQKQLSKCGICGSKDPKNKRSRYNIFCVDHNHKTGKVRGLLCQPCNMLLVPSVEHYRDLIEQTKKYLGESVI